MLRLMGDVCVLSLGVMGINYKTAGLGLREAIARGAEVLAGEKGLFFSHPTILLSTCNRTEIYFSGEDLPSAHSDLLNMLRRHVEEPFEHRLYSYFGIDCFAHLCRVASGLDSAILAETEIQRQVKVAYQQSASRLCLPSCLHFAFQKALKVGKSVRSQLFFEQGSPSLNRTIWQIAEKFWGDLKSNEILLVGYSEINRALASFLLHKGLSVTLCTKEPDKVRHFGCRIVGRPILQQWDQFHTIVCASKAGEYLIQGAASSPRLIFDLSVPRNVDPNTGKTSQLYNIEEIDHIIEQMRFARTTDLAACEELVWETALRLARIYREKRQAAVAAKLG